MQSATKKTVLVYSVLGMVGATLILFTKVLGMHRSDAVEFLLPILALLLVVGAAYDFFALLCLLMGWLPFFKGVLQIPIGVITFNPYALGMIAFALLALGRALLGRRRYGLTPTDIAIVALCGVFLASTLFSNDLISTGYLAFHALFIPVVSYYALKTFVNSEAQYRQVVWSFVVGVGIFSCIAIVRFLAVHERVSVVGIPFIGVATFTLSAFLLLVFGGLWRSYSQRIVALLIFVGFVVTFSRAYLFYLLLTPILFKLIRRGHASKLIIGLFVISLTATVAVAYNADYFKPAHFNRADINTSKRLTSISNWKYSIYGRALDYREGLDTFFANPVIGVGIQKGAYVVTQHDFQVEWLEYGGIVGYLLYVATFLLHFRRVGRRATEDRLSAVGLLIILVIMGNSVTNGFMHGVMPYMVFILMGLNEARLKFAYRQSAPVPSVVPDQSAPVSGRILAYRRSRPELPRG